LNSIARPGHICNVNSGSKETSTIDHYAKDVTVDEEPYLQQRPPKRAKINDDLNQELLQEPLRRLNRKTRPEQIPYSICRRRSDIRGERLGGFTGLEYRRMRRTGLPVWSSRAITAFPRMHFMAQ